MILTDHKPLVAFPKQTELLGRQVRWQNMINNFICPLQYIDSYKNVIADAFSRVFINLEILATLSDFFPSKIEALEPPASTNIYASISAAASSANSSLHLSMTCIPIVISAASTTQSIAKKIEETPQHHPFLEIHIPK